MATFLISPTVIPSGGAKSTFSGHTYDRSPIVGLFNYLIGGLGRIYGTVKVDGSPDTPVFRRVRLHRDKDGMVVNEQWSDPVTGAYDFQYIQTGYTYTVIAYDHTEDFRAVVADRIEPELMPAP